MPIHRQYSRWWHAQRSPPRCRRVACVCVLLLAAAAAATASSPPTEAVYRKLCRSIRLQHVRALFTASARADPPRRIERLRVLAEGRQRARRRRPGVPPDRRRRPDAVEAPRRPSVRSVSHADRSRPAREVGLPGRTACRRSSTPARGTFTCTLIPGDGGHEARARAGAGPGDRADVRPASRCGLCADVFAAYR